MSSNYRKLTHTSFTSGSSARPESRQQQDKEIISKVQKSIQNFSIQNSNQSSQSSLSDFQHINKQKTNYQQTHLQQYQHYSNNCQQQQQQQLQEEYSNKTEKLKLNQAIYEMFIYFRQKMDKNFLIDIQQQIPQEDTIEQIQTIDPIQILQFIKIIFDTLIDKQEDLKEELKVCKNDDNNCNDYEQQLQKLEAEIREHIRIEQQLKLYVETTQAKMEEIEFQKDNEFNNINQNLQVYVEQVQQLKEEIKTKDWELETIHKELQNKEESIKLMNDKNKIYELRLNQAQKQLSSSRHITDSFSQDYIENQDHQDCKIINKGPFLALTNKLNQLEKKKENESCLLERQNQKINSSINNTNNSMLNTNQQYKSTNSAQAQLSNLKVVIQQHLKTKIDNHYDFSNKENQKNMINLQKNVQQASEKRIDEVVNIQKKLKQLQKMSEKKRICSNNIQPQKQFEEDQTSERFNKRERGSINKYNNTQQFLLQNENDRLEQSMRLSKNQNAKTNYREQNSFNLYNTNKISLNNLSKQDCAISQQINNNHTEMQQMLGNSKIQNQQLNDCYNQGNSQLISDNSFQNRLQTDGNNNSRNNTNQNGKNNSYEKLCAFMNSPKYKFEVKTNQSNGPRSQSVDGTQQLYKMCQQKIDSNINQVSFAFENSQNMQPQQTSKYLNLSSTNLSNLVKI